MARKRNLEDCRDKPMTTTEEAINSMKQANVPIPQLNAERWLHMYRQMARIRTFEQNANELYLSAKMPGLTHLSTGQEAVAVGVCEALQQGDYITSTHRGHGHCLAKGAKLDLMFAELLGKEAGYCRGKGARCTLLIKRMVISELTPSSGRHWHCYRSSSVRENA